MKLETFKYLVLNWEDDMDIVLNDDCSLEMSEETAVELYNKLGEELGFHQPDIPFEPGEYTISIDTNDGWNYGGLVLQEDHDYAESN